MTLVATELPNTIRNSEDEVVYQILPTRRQTTSRVNALGLLGLSMILSVTWVQVMTALPIFKED